ncbi:hypothetical protein PLESTB_000622800 [Pleodorina starrii]|uniref:AP2/ERF domain-containing protein n=1 Tax=Pleodorina starrii TaxID=330485 RepID=A0A9W6F1J5_9CHLO|nr:hypothetical protein PLESTB_000622800 [Pleodorina starrii]
MEDMNDTRSPVQPSSEDTMDCFMDYITIVDDHDYQDHPVAQQALVEQQLPHANAAVLQQFTTEQDAMSVEFVTSGGNAGSSSSDFDLMDSIDFSSQCWHGDAIMSDTDGNGNNNVGSDGCTTSNGTPTSGVHPGLIASEGAAAANTTSNAITAGAANVSTPQLVQQPPLQSPHAHVMPYIDDWSAGPSPLNGAFIMPDGTIFQGGAGPQQGPYNSPHVSSSQAAQPTNPCYPNNGGDAFIQQGPMMVGHDMAAGGSAAGAAAANGGGSACVPRAGTRMKRTPVQRNCGGDIGGGSRFKKSRKSGRTDKSTQAAANDLPGGSNDAMPPKKKAAKRTKAKGKAAKAAKEAKAAEAAAGPSTSGGHNARKKTKGSSSVYKGVCKSKQYFEAHFWNSRAPRKTGGRRFGKQVYLGGFTSELWAAVAYDLAAIVFWSEKAQTNFPMEEYRAHMAFLSTLSEEDISALLQMAAKMNPDGEDDDDIKVVDPPAAVVMLADILEEVAAKYRDVAPAGAAEEEPAEEPTEEDSVEEDSAEEDSAEEDSDDEGSGEEGSDE